MRTLQFVGVAVVAVILTIKTIRDIVEDTQERSKYVYGHRGSNSL